MRGRILGFIISIDRVDFSKTLSIRPDITEQKQRLLLSTITALKLNQNSLQMC